MAKWLSHAFDEKGIVSSEIYQKLLFGKLEVNEGMLIEKHAADYKVEDGITYLPLYMTPLL